MTLDDSKNFTTWLAGIFLVGWIINAFVSAAITDRDDSDPLEGPLSNMAVRTDALTGCQYLETKSGGITPRLDASGEQVGCRGR